MDEVSITLGLYRVLEVIVAIGAISSILLGVLLLSSPDFVHRFNKWINRPVVTFDTIIGERPRHTGSLLLLLSATLWILFLIYP